MLYIIDNDILDKICDDKISGNDLEKLDLLFGILEKIMLSKFNGVLVADNNFQNRYANLKKTNFIQTHKPASKVFYYIFENYQEIYNLIQQLPIKALITWQKNNTVQTAKQINLQDTIQIDVDTFVSVSRKINFDDIISLTVENPTDYHLYQNFVCYFGPSFDKTLKYYRLNMANGGGGSIGYTMEGEIYINHRLTVAITDSDKSVSKSTDYLGSTAKNAVRTAENLNSRMKATLTKVFILSVNEKENLFTPKEYESAFQNSSEGEKKTLNYLKNIEKELNKNKSPELESFLCTFDYKKGISELNYPVIVANNQQVHEIANRSNSLTRDLIGLGDDPVKRFFPIQDSNHCNYYTGSFNIDILDVNSFIHSYRSKIAYFMYALGFGFYPMSSL
ncbi:hypothetical protein [Leuconostoc mesenteroides]|uniref:hypothetical protein n=1 Tax=Leuconostoc mesenteroides TaxID=1245 RepID=UPI0023622D7D|nr:hypothetical protein [Leuconostoc mesenteroides]